MYDNLDWYYLDAAGRKKPCRSVSCALVGNYLVSQGIRFTDQCHPITVAVNLKFDPSFYLLDSDTYLDVRRNPRKRSTAKDLIPLLREAGYKIEEWYATHMARVGVMPEPWHIMIQEAESKCVHLIDYVGQSMYLK